MSFEEYLNTNYNEKLDDLTKFLINDAFKAGAQSRQKEIDELKNKKEFRDLSQDIAIKNLKEKHEKQVGGLAKAITKMDLEIDELQKRIDEALNTLCKLQYSSGERIYNDVGDILKGKNND